MKNNKFAKITIALLIALIMVFTIGMTVGCRKAIALARFNYSTVLTRRMPQLNIGDETELKILQLTDLHLLGTNRDKRTLEDVDKTISRGDYDLVVLTGDMFEGYTNKGYDKPRAVQSLVQIFNDNQIYFTIAFGNNDGEYLGDNIQIVGKFFASKFFLYSDTASTDGIGNFYIDIINSKDEVLHKLVIMDTRMRDDKGIYHHISDKQVSWYKQIAATVNGRDNFISMFIHIPFDAFTVALDKVTNYHGYNNYIGFKIDPNTNNNAPLYEAVVKSGVCGLVAAGHYHNVNAIKSYAGMYQVVTKSGGYFTKIGSEIKYGGNEININMNTDNLSDKYTFNEVNY